MKKVLVLFPRLLLLFSFSLFLARCSDDDEPQTTADLLLGSWVMTGDTYSPAYDFGAGPVSDAFPLYDDCEKDNIFIMVANFVGEFNEGATKCDPADPQTEAFAWTLKSNNTILTISQTIAGITIGLDFEILQLDASTLKLKYTFVESGVTYTNTTTYARQ
jgi:hypothetical protein